jgi:hypothetical protein
MSVISKSFLGKIFPELDWQELDSNNYDSLFKTLMNSGQDASTTLNYLKEHKVKVGFHSQDSSGGGWTLLRNITLTPGTDPATHYNISLIVHEVFHLQQSLLTRLSVYGELLAWQYQGQAYRQAFGKGIGDPGEAYPRTQDKWDELAKLSPASREDLATAQQVMKEISPDYRSDCLPLYPLIREIGFDLRQGKFGNAFETIGNLITCR